MQVQRGLGASKIAVPSVGGTINIISKATDAKKGGSVFIGTGNNLYNKVGISLSTGVNDKGWAMTLQGTRTQGENYADGLQFLGWSYFMNIAKKINDDHLVTFTVIGAQQQHGQRQNYLPYTTFKNSPNGRRQNNDWGKLGGEVVQVEDNFYHKPQISLNHYWTINATTELATTAYVSFGTGGGGGIAGNNLDLFQVRTGGDGPTYGYIDLDNIVSVNEAAAANGNESEAYLRASRNDHNWYGLLSVLTKEIGSNFVLSAGIDGRYYRGKHFREITNLLGGDFVINNRDVNNPNQVIGVGDKFAYNNDGIVKWLGGFAQGEYTLDALTMFASASVSNSSYTREDYFQYTPGNQLSETKNFLGYVFKAGANYNLSDHHNVFLNAGYFERAPFFNGVFTSFTNEANPNAVNEKVLGLEAGYGIRYSKGGVSFNAYSTNWRDKTFTQRIQVPSGEDVTVNVLGVNAIHQGVEAEFYYNPTSRLKMRGSVSLGNWRWQNDLIDVPVFDENNDEIGTVDLYLKDVKVGDAAQTTAAIGLDYELFDGFSVNGDFTYADNLYARFDALQRGDAPASGETNVQALKLPAYGLFDFGFRYAFKLGNLDASLNGRMNNAFDTEYVPDAWDAADLASARVFMGFGRTWTMGLRVKF
ncbi:MAG: hypothetical protein L3J06_06890 [Cyclobacteriaceae bacterium]|nr:hypothetical protein [Cyclobacteriaceae bacterium]